jgi:hypothetical protein
MAVIYENDADHPMQEGDIDGMAWFLDEDTPLPTDWDIMIENPPHEGYDGPDLQKIT